jgi:hypothetical protein
MDAFLVAGKHFDVIVVYFAVVKARVLCSKREGEVATHDKGASAVFGSAAIMGLALP